MRELSWVLVFGEAGGVEMFEEIGGLRWRLLGAVSVSRGGHCNRVKVEGFKELPFFGGGEKGVLHEGIEGLEALNVEADGVDVALFGEVEGVLFGVAEAAKVGECGLPARGRAEVIVIEGCGGAIGLDMRGFLAGLDGAIAGVDVSAGCEFPAAVGVGLNKVGWCAVAEDGKRFFMTILLDEALRSEVFAGKASLSQIVVDEYTMCFRVVRIFEMEVCQSIGIFVAICALVSYNLLAVSLLILLVKARTLSPTKMAVSCWFLLAASSRQSRRYWSMNCWKYRRHWSHEGVRSGSVYEQHLRGNRSRSIGAPSPEH